MFFKEVSRMSAECFDGVLQMFLRSFLRFSGKLYRYFLSGSRCFKSAFRKFCFVILLLHDTHRSYPNRRRACFNRGGKLFFQSFPDLGDYIDIKETL